MSSIQAPVCVHYHDPPRNESVFSGDDFLSLDAFFHRSALLEEENTMT